MRCGTLESSLETTSQDDKDARAEVAYGNEIRCGLANRLLSVNSAPSRLARAFRGSCENSCIFELVQVNIFGTTKG